MNRPLESLKELLALYHGERGGSVSETVDGVRELSAMFNGVLPLRPGYMAAGRLRRAYVHYYLAVHAEKVARVLQELRTYAALPAAPKVLDFGCGPGTAAIALLLGGPRPRELWLVDVVDRALDDADFLVRALGARPRLAPEVPRGRFDLVLAANVLSETAASLEESLEETGHLVIVEPALKAATRRLMEARDRYVKSGLQVAAPCLRQSRCPMLEHEALWCHQDVPWPRPKSVAEVDRRLGLSKESIKYSYLVLTRAGRTLSDRPGEWRLVSNLHRQKGKAWAWLCGRQGPLCRAEILTRHRSPATHAFFRAERGDVLSMEVSGGFTRSMGPIEKTR